MPNWSFDMVPPGTMERNPVSEEFFANGTRLEAVIRESLQNSLDATDGGNEPVEVRIYFSDEAKQLPHDRLKPYFPDGAPGTERFTDSRNGLVSPQKVMGEACRFLVIEDFHTTGLTGKIDERPNEEDLAHRNDWNYYNYFFRENGSTKLGAGTLGSWGAGKCVFQRASRLKCSFTYSVRNDQYQPQAFVVGKATLKYHTDDNHVTWAPDGWFGEMVQQTDPLKMQKLPITDSRFIDTFKTDFNIKREDNQPGTSIVIPYITLSQGDENEGAFNQQNLVNAVLRNFLVAIVENKLKVTLQVGNDPEVVIDQTRVGTDLFLPDPGRGAGNVTNLHQKLILTDFSATQEVRLASPGDDPVWNRTMFEDEQLRAMRKLLQENNPCKITVPIPIRKKKPDGSVEITNGDFIILLKKQNLRYSLPPAFYRVGLLIDAVSTTKLNNYIAVVLIQPGLLADLLVAAEPPSHSKWNYDTDRVAKEYDRPRKHISFVSYAVRDILDTIATFDQERNYDPLRDVFGIKKDSSELHDTDGNEAVNVNGEGGNRPVPKLPPKGRIVEISGITGGIQVTPGSSLSTTSVPLTATFFVGYDTFRGLDWTPNDFDLENGSGGVRLSVEEGNVKAEGKENKIILTINDRNPFRVTVKGFDSNRDIIATKVRYDHKSNDDPEKEKEVEDGVSI